MTTRARIAALAGLMALASCKSLEVGDLNNPAFDDLARNPNRVRVLAAASGLLVGLRGGVGGTSGFGNQNGYIVLLGVLGREGYNFDAADPRFVTELLIGPLDGGSPAFGGNLWTQPYANIRNADVVQQAVGLLATDPVAGLTAAEKEGVLGFAKTIKALDLLHVINTRDSLGAVIQVPDDPTTAPGAIATRTQVFSYIVALLDSAQTHLQSPGAAFAFALSSGFSGFSTPSTFLQVNRAIRARVAAYLGDWNGVLTALGASFLSTTASLQLGVFHVFSPGSGDQLNALFDPQARALMAHPSLRTDAQLQAGGARDQRFLDKVATTTSKTVQGITTDLLWTRYSGPFDAIPIIRNEELILLRAEANIQLGNLATATTDLDLIRQTSGNLPALGGGLTQAQLIDEVLYNRRYSLLWEGGHRWIDMRRYGRLGQLPQDLATHRRFARFPFPIGECDARSSAPPGCGTIAGF